MITRYLLPAALASLTGCSIDFGESGLDGLECSINEDLGRIANLGDSGMTGANGEAELFGLCRGLVSPCPADRAIAASEQVVVDIVSDSVELEGRQVALISLDPSVFTVTEQSTHCGRHRARLQALEPGEVTVAVTVDDEPLEAFTLRVERASEAEIALVGTGEQVEPGEQALFALELRDADGDTLAFEGPVAWSIGDEAVLQPLEGDGSRQLSFEAIAPGQTQVAATFRDVEATLDVTVE